MDASLLTATSRACVLGNDFVSSAARSPGGARVAVGRELKIPSVEVFVLLPSAKEECREHRKLAQQNVPATVREFTSPWETSPFSRPDCLAFGHHKQYNAGELEVNPR
jgi:hypothetical protein